MDSVNSPGFVMTNSPSVAGPAPAPAARSPLVFNRQAPSEASIHVYAEIGESGVTAQAFADALAEAKGVKTLHVYVDSPGGDLMTGKAIYNQIARFAKTAMVIATVDGLAASAASFLIMAASRIRMTQHATMMIHEAQSVGWGRASDLRKLADVLDAENRNLIDIYAKRTKHDPAHIASLMAAETWFSAEEAVSNGFADEVMGEVKASAPAPIAAEVTPADRIAAAHRALRIAAMRAETLRVRNRTGASPGAGQGQPCNDTNAVRENAK